MGLALKGLSHGLFSSVFTSFFFSQEPFSLFFEREEYSFSSEEPWKQMFGAPYLTAACVSARAIAVALASSPRRPMCIPLKGLHGRPVYIPFGTFGRQEKVPKTKGVF